MQWNVFRRRDYQSIAVQTVVHSQDLLIRVIAMYLQINSRLNDQGQLGTSSWPASEYGHFRNSPRSMSRKKIWTKHNSEYFSMLRWFNIIMKILTTGVSPVWWHHVYHPNLPLSVVIDSTCPTHIVTGLRRHRRWASPEKPFRQQTKVYFTRSSAFQNNSHRG
jgi:hypothetical protein